MITDEFIRDIKLLFDGLRNIAICVALAAGLPIIEKVTPMIFDSSLLKFTVVTLSISVIILLYVFNIIWLHVSFEQKSTSKILHVVGFTTLLLLVTIATGAAVFIEIWPQLTVYE
jgi:uncharacterized membrane protein